MKYVVNNIASDKLHTARFNGKDYYVIPVVALVEGPIQAANSSRAELALAEHFGQNVQSWNGRPLTIGHPKIQGNFVSANDPRVLEQFAIGFIFNAHIDDRKLKVDAWVDIDKVATIPEALEALEAIKSGQTLEVSTGLFANVINVNGKYNGKDYQGVWINVSPDHLALLPLGVKGACSIEDGCGIPRVNQMPELILSQEEIAKIQAAYIEQLFPASQKLNCDCTKDVGTETKINKQETDMPKDEMEDEKKEKKDMANPPSVKDKEEDEDKEKKDAESGMDTKDPKKDARKKDDKVMEAPVTSLEALLANAAPELRESIEYGIRAHSKARSDLIERIKTNNANKFSDDQLKAFSMDILENIAALIPVPRTYEGKAPGIMTHSGSDDSIPPAPRLFEKKG